MLKTMVTDEDKSSISSKLKLSAAMNKGNIPLHLLKGRKQSESLSSDHSSDDQLRPKCKIQRSNII